MKQVQKKTLDPAVGQMLLTARRRRLPLAWDRAEGQQPRCGFGRLALCCSDCQEGVCRINPFGGEEQRTICGRGKEELIGRRLTAKTADGALALLKLAAAGYGIGGEWMQELLPTADEMLAEESYAARLFRLGRCTGELLGALQAAKHAGGSWQPQISQVNLGVLRADQVNIVFCGHVPAAVVAGLRTAAGSLAIPVVFGAVCGNEWSDGLGIPALTNYDSQETPLLTGAVDLLVVGRQCVMPAVIRLAEQLDIAKVDAASLDSTDAFTSAAAAAQASFRRRDKATLAIPAESGPVYAGFSAGSIAGLLTSLDAPAAGPLRGVVYLGGCGSVANTQDARPAAIAAALVMAGYLVVTAGCAGVSLAKAGMCRTEWRDGQHGLQRLAAAGLPPVLTVGSCQDAGEFLQLARQLPGLTTAAFFPEINHNKVLAAAVAFAAAGIDTWVDWEAAAADDAVASCLEREFVSRSGAGLRPLPEQADWPELLAALRPAEG
ncbi:MAG: hypothetical protein E6X17_00795 [Sporomusaceae bacterium]|nr:hypothetical protein [Sporomusaceae bacterium]